MSKKRKRISQQPPQPEEEQQESNNNNDYNDNDNDNDYNRDFPSINYYYNQHPNMSSTSSSSTSRRAKWGRHGGVTVQIDEVAVNAMFDEIADLEDDNVANMEGISTLCEHLEIDPVEDVRILVLLHKLVAATGGGGGGAKSSSSSRSSPQQITRQEWVDGCRRLRVDSLEKLKALLPSLELGFMEAVEFREFFKFCFKFNLEGTHKTLDKDLVIALVDLTLKGRIDPQRIVSFQEFLNTTKDASYNRITLDQWVSFLDFSMECTDLSQYDEENSAWPVLIDDYVDFCNHGMKM
mmetsp:Transcript_11913/g.22307  ORF Transcript_11913/g.22307 Transcript_11913/m.22307 type:complete len:294 (+) Transcript_11913:384-1265(+)|eukprot:CAMPEP_0176485714 /NCGR_PEP_ID=MMETSP0200_2-20121128/5184_1 /TAXON_ID=947934 /ORGANISM="Chaetoceros sp., Strain GSL56" /LENGTH=293 /DNA_ID=CAMNT_0017882371 /DNA_START=314 /DNA_END=1195 /DNA_ORIENTATION=+